jgi:hypothetical protein
MLALNALINQPHVQFIAIGIYPEAVGIDKMAFSSAFGTVFYNSV